MRAIIILALLAAMLTSPALATPYWIAYEGNDFPENEGWTRGFSAGGANRYIEDGALVIDSRSSTAIYEDYQWLGISDPLPGELFVAEFRVRVEYQSPWYDASFAVIRDMPEGELLLRLAPDDVYIWRERERIAVGNGWHTYRIESHDMLSYDLRVDGVLAYQGAFETNTFLRSFVLFGDTAVGSSSLSRWDYVRFGVVPEPATTIFLFVSLVFQASIRKR